jgi:hypothetical protein
MNEILDSIEEEIRPKTFSQLSFGTALITICAFVYVNNLMPSDMKLSDGFPVVNPVLIWTMRLNFLLGFVCTVISFIKKEPSSKVKWIGGIVNALVFVLCLVVLILLIKMGKTQFFSHLLTNS